MVNLNLKTTSLTDAQDQLEKLFQCRVDSFNGIKATTGILSGAAQFVAPVTRLVAPAATKDAVDATTSIETKTRLNTKILTKTYNTLFLKYTIANAIFYTSHPENLSDHVVKRLENAALAFAQTALLIVQVVPTLFYSLASLFTLFQNENFNHQTIVEMTQLVSHAMLIAIHVVGIFSLGMHHEMAIEHGQFLLNMDNTKSLMEQL